MDEQMYDPFHGHIPSPSKWTTEQRNKFLFYAQVCPTCAYKKQYYEILELQRIIAQLPEDSLQMDSMTENVAHRIEELVQLGFHIATEQCSNNVTNFIAMTN